MSCAVNNASLNPAGGIHEHSAVIPRELMARVLEHARRHGVDSAIDDLLGEKIDRSCRINLREPTRIDWRLLLGLSHRDRVLDVGSGWGRLAFALAPFVGHVYSLEASEQHLAFQQIMLEQHGDPNITLLHGEFLELPFQSETLDWVIMNGFLHSIGRAGATSSLRMQAKVLQRAFDLLQPGAHVAIGVENRWGLHALFGQRRGDRTNTHGLDAYHRLLVRCGADEVRSFALLPHHRKPRAIIPVSPPCPPAAQAFAIDQVWSRASPAAAFGRRLLGLCVHARVMRYVYPHYLLIGRKPC